VLGFDYGGDAPQWWKVVYCVQQPEYLALCRLEEEPNFLDTCHAGTEEVGLEYAARYKTIFACNFAALADATDLQPIEEARISVLQNLVHDGWTAAHTDGPPLPFARFEQSLPEERAAPASQPRAPRTRKPEQDLAALYPWLAEDLDKKGLSRADKAQGSQEGEDDDDDDAECDWAEAADEQVELQLRELHVARALLSDAPLAKQANFGTRVLGGAFTVGATGSAYDAMQGFCRNRLAEDWCLSRGAQRSMRFDPRQIGDASAGILARAWAHRMQFFMDREVFDPSLVGGPFPVSVVAEYEEPSEFTALALRASPAELRHVDRVRALFAP
jgi:hypothetical protein